MIDTDKYEDAKKMVQNTGLIDENDGYPDIHYIKIAHLLTEVKQLRKRLEAFDCMRFDIEHAIDHSWASWEDLKVFLKEMIE